MSVTKEDLLKQVGQFTWFWGHDFFIETTIGNFHWKDTVYGGDHTITPFVGDYDAFRRQCGMQYGRDKGSDFIVDRCGSSWTFVLPPVT